MRRFARPVVAAGAGVWYNQGKTRQGGGDLLRQIRYFQSVVRNNSFSEAAEECHISQSAISQQVKALEAELGFALLERKNRKFVLTPGGRHFYQKSLVLVADYEQLCRESARLARGEQTLLKIGCLRGYAGEELPQALEEFAADSPTVSVRLVCGSHEELFDLLRTGGVDLVLNDQRRAFSEEYVNLVLAGGPLCVEVPARSGVAVLPAVTAEDLKPLPCILVAPASQWETEQEYYRAVIGLQGEFLPAQSREEARLMVAAGQGFLPVEGPCRPGGTQGVTRRLPLYRGGAPVTRNYCLFWKKVNDAYSIRAFAHILQRKFR